MATAEVEKNSHCEPDPDPSTLQERASPECKFKTFTQLLE